MKNSRAHPTTVQAMRRHRRTSELWRIISHTLARGVSSRRRVSALNAELAAAKSLLANADNAAAERLHEAGAAWIDRASRYVKRAMAELFTSVKQVCTEQGKADIV